MQRAEAGKPLRRNLFWKAVVWGNSGCGGQAGTQSCLVTVWRELRWASGAGGRTESCWRFCSWDKVGQYKEKTLFSWHHFNECIWCAKVTTLYIHFILSTKLSKDTSKNILMNTKLNLQFGCVFLLTGDYLCVCHCTYCILDTFLWASWGNLFWMNDKMRTCVYMWPILAENIINHKK